VLKGTGTVVGNVNNTGGAVAPGDAPGILTINGNYTQGLGGSFDELLAGTTVGTGYSQLDIVGGVASLNGALDITKSAGFSLAVGDVFTIMQFASSTDNFSSFECNGASWSFTSGMLGCANGVQFTKLFASGDTMLNLVVDHTGMSTVPEASTWAMVLLGFAGLGFIARRSSSRAATAA
jgi:hypothetical protein